ncbi:MerR family transcriptional regulator [Streptomyces sp. NPDC094472]|uniref:MerR family transcriptional regulator n=1 Tax=Streptomyces sp. NPDC094472 TaxID=3155080 RepID=UPI0033227E4D
MTTTRISQLAERAGVPATTLRFYEGAGLLPADRTPAGYRVYGEDAVEPPAARPVDVELAPSHRTAEEQTERWSGATVACPLSGQGMAERTSAWHAVPGGALRAAIPDGLRLTLPAERAAATAELAAAEHRCCPFFDGRLHLDGPHLHLDVRTSAYGAGLLTEAFGAVT